MRIALVQRSWFENIGVMSLSAVLKARGYEVDVFIGVAENHILRKIVQMKPGLVGFSCSSGEHLWALKTAKELKALANVFVLFGGSHPTFAPDIIDLPGIDAVCRGEGETPLIELADSLNAGKVNPHIKSLYVKLSDKIIRNDMGPLIPCLDHLPIPDRSIYDKYKDFQRQGVKHFMASRGCLFNCNYCYNHVLKDLYKGERNPLRFRSPGHIIKEIKQVKTRYPLRTVVFDDDIFIYDKAWLEGFLFEYNKHIRIPFICNVHASLVDEDVSRMLKTGGCFRVSMGVETGDENSRINLLNKNITDQQILYAAECLHRHGIKILTNNMLGLPGETLSGALKTVAINIRIKPDYPWCSILQPYPGTKIEEVSIKNGFLHPTDKGCFSPTFFRRSNFSYKDIDKIIRLQKLFYLAVRFPALLALVKLLIRLPLDLLYHMVFAVTFAYRYKKANRLTYFECIKFGLRNLTLY